MLLFLRTPIIMIIIYQARMLPSQMQELIFQKQVLDFDCHERLDDMPDIGADEFNSILNNTDFNLENKLVHIFPNPNYGKLIIENKTDIFIEIIDLNGKIIFSNKLLIGNHKLFLNKISTGIYLLKWVSENNRGMEKVILMKY